ncbi:hypothetical protein FOXB_16493 [Fusarium oxysporum f. sp. conglutinans Fo5176]|uniref:Uncharacterized protein n=1 Tax=Fusarium oxysporum (strain Fo5176) TaxID=660025 RepID=F9GCW0_FUSOF|nr:hypothetical protein FOXB_16493 [Fusarium oxysporum f. sp. conglutinans Fo5176]
MYILAMKKLLPAITASNLVALWLR